MANSIIVLDQEKIEEKIYFIRNKKVMLDFDLAEIYGYTTKRFNEQVQRNIEKFDDDFMFKLTQDEFLNLRSQFATSSWGGKRYLPYAFTEEGIYMLMTVLKGELATKQSKALIRIFKGMKDYIINTKNLLSYDNIMNLALQTNKNTNDINEIKNELKSIHNLLDYKKDFLFLNGEYVESDLAYKKIYSLAKKSIYIIDDYIDLKTLVLLKDVKETVNIIIFSDNVNKKLHKLEYQDFIKEYPNLNIKFIKTNNIIHDRYIIIDYGKRTEKIYHCGGSSKDSGKKITSITELNDNKIYKSIIDNVLENEELILK